MGEMNLLTPHEVRLQHPDDVREYGEGPWIYDEMALLSLPAKELIALERMLDMSIPVLMARVRADWTDAKLAATWLARRMTTGDKRLGFIGFTPLVHLSSWTPRPIEGVDDVAAGEGGTPLDPSAEEASDSSPETASSDSSTI